MFSKVSEIVTVLLWINSALNKNLMSSQSLQVRPLQLLQEYFKTSSNKNDLSQFLNRDYFDKNTWDFLHKHSLHYTSIKARVSIESHQHEIVKKGQHSIWPTEEKSPLHLYEMEDVVCCLDSLNIAKNHGLHISFIGDSLTRNQFKNFIASIPDYDRKVTHNETNVGIQSKFHEDRNVTSKIFNDLLVSFRWRAIINAELIADIKLWTDMKDHQVPDIVFIGCTAHNMLKKLYNLPEHSFLETMEHDLLPALSDYLSAHPKKQLFWIIQSPTKDLLAPISFLSYNNIIHIKKIEDYNEVIRQVFSGTQIALWDSLNPAIEENIRSCALHRFLRGDNSGYQLCGDYLHFGHQILSIGTQLILNHLCNHPLAKYKLI